jgi:peptidyl-prolyl cis-trans isomerase B (cyclophilin B)
VTGPPPVLPPPPAVPPGAAYAPVAGRTTNGLAVASLITAFMLPPLAIVFGHVALSQIKRSHGAQDGRGMAIAGAAIGYASIVLTLALYVAWVTGGPE